MPDQEPDAPDAVADELYRVDPADFVARRAELVRRLRADKERDVAGRVAKLRRPSPAAWAVNQLARDHRDDLEGLVRLGDDLRAAQTRALGGHGGADLRHAAQARRDAVAALTGAAARLLAQRGGGVDAHLAGVTATLDAASLDAGAGATVLAGRLSSELAAPSGFGGLAVDLPDVVEPKPERDAEPGSATPEPASRDRRDVEEAEQAVAAAGRRAEELAAAARAAAARASERRRVVEAAEADVAARRRQLDEAERRLADAAREAEDARRAAHDADAAAQAADEDLHAAERRLRDASR
ncbi:MAG TPA: hypothetical protein VHT97_13950 [Acidimicrobiales bacterium]|nr:hypothetical protein [Acidimicrobiales bacterium]